MACDCIEKCDAEIQKHFPGIYHAPAFTLDGSPRKMQLVLERREGRGRVPISIATFCPICGTRYEPKE